MAPTVGTAQMRSEWKAFICCYVTTSCDLENRFISWSSAAQQRHDLSLAEIKGKIYNVSIVVCSLLHFGCSSFSESLWLTVLFPFFKELQTRGPILLGAQKHEHRGIHRPASRGGQSNPEDSPQQDDMLELSSVLQSAWCCCSSLEQTAYCCCGHLGLPLYGCICTFQVPSGHVPLSCNHPLLAWISALLTFHLHGSYTHVQNSISPNTLHTACM